MIFNPSHTRRHREPLFLAVAEPIDKAVFHQTVIGEIRKVEYQIILIVGKAHIFHVTQALPSVDISHFAVHLDGDELDRMDRKLLVQFLGACGCQTVFGSQINTVIIGSIADGLIGMSQFADTFADGIAHRSNPYPVGGCHP